MTTHTRSLDRWLAQGLTTVRKRIADIETELADLRRYEAALASVVPTSTNGADPVGQAKRAAEFALRRTAPKKSAGSRKRKTRKAVIAERVANLRESLSLRERVLRIMPNTEDTAATAADIAHVLRKHGLDVRDPEKRVGTELWHLASRGDVGRVREGRTVRYYRRDD